jgi:DNA-directed RNA polymerase subunit RPC12/RpoP
MIIWKDYSGDIMQLYSEGYSSSEIGELLSDLHETPEVNKPRQIRRVIQKERDNLTEIKKIPVNHTAKILIFDIETAPHRAYVWKFWKENVGQNQVISDWFCLTWSAKWLFEDDVISAKLTPSEVKNEDDERIVRRLWSLLDESHIVVAHNAINFDIKKINTRFIQYNLPPPSPYEVIDTLAHAKKRFGFSSNRLNYINAVLGLEVKQDTGGFELWAKCMEGSQEALNNMESYNIQDVRILEDLYLKMRPWIQPHPNIGLHIEDNVVACPSCGHDHLEPCGTYNTYVNIYEALRCKSCGAVSRSRKPITNKVKSKNLAVSTPR